MVTVHVTQDHIDCGIAKACKECPMALAINDVLADGWYASCDPFRIILLTAEPERYKGEYPPTYPMPKAGAEFIMAFDWMGNAEPFDFEIDIPEALCRPK